MRDQKDLEQIIWTAAYRNLQNADPARIGAWIRTIATRAIRDYFELHATRSENPVEDHWLVVTDPTPPVDAILADRTLLRLLLEELPADERRMVERRRIDDVPITTIAAEMHLTEGKAYSMLRRAEAKLVAAAERHEAVDRRRLGEARAIAIPFAARMPWGHGRLEALAIRAKAFGAHVRSALSLAAKGLVSAAAPALTLGATMVPPAPCVPAKPLSPASAATAIAARATAAPVPANPVPAAPDPPPAGAGIALASSAAAPSPSLGESRAPRAAASSAAIPPGVAERLSLESIHAMIDVDPAAALAALGRHRRAFPRDELNIEREALEILAQAKVDRARRLSSPPPRRAPSPARSADPRP